jgi:hypothetical protein
MPNANDLEKYYKALTDRELLKLRWKGGFTAEANLVLEEEMARRNLGSRDLNQYVADEDLTFEAFAARLR